MKTIHAFLLSTALTLPAFGQSPDDPDVRLPSGSKTDNLLDLAAADANTFVAAWVDSTTDPRVRSDYLVLATSHDKGQNWTQIYRGSVGETYISDISLDVSSSAGSANEPARWAFVAVQGVHPYRSIWWETISVVSGPIDTHWNVAPHRRCVVDSHGLTSPTYPEQDLHISCVVAPYVDSRRQDRYAIAVAYKAFSKHVIGMNLSTDGGFWMQKPFQAAGPEATIRGDDFIWPSLAVDREDKWIYLAAEETSRETVKVGQVQIADLVSGRRPFTEVYETDPSDGVREFAPDIAAEDGFATLVYLEGKANSYGEYRMGRSVQTRNYPFSPGPAITSQALGVPDIAMFERQIYVAAHATMDRNGGFAYPGVFAFQGDFLGAMTRTQVNEVTVARHVRPRVAVRDNAGPRAAAYGYAEEVGIIGFSSSEAWVDPAR